MKGTKNLDGMIKPAASSLPQQVQEIFQSDGVLHEAISRGFVNYRALSRWMISAYDLKGSEDAVLSAIRRLKRGAHFDPFRAARGIISGCHLNLRSRVCQLILPKTEDMRQKLPKIIELIDFTKGEMLYITWGEAGIKVVIDESNLTPVQSMFGTKMRKVVGHLSALTVVEPEHGLDTPGILALLCETLALQGINIVDAVYGYPDYTFFVKEPDTLRGYQSLESLIQRAETRTKRSSA